jgi:hypothetical protein
MVGGSKSIEGFKEVAIVVDLNNLRRHERYDSLSNQSALARSLKKELKKKTMNAIVFGCYWPRKRT